MIEKWKSNQQKNWSIIAHWDILHNNNSKIKKSVYACNGGCPKESWSMSKCLLKKQTNKKQEQKSSLGHFVCTFETVPNSISFTVKSGFNIESRGEKDEPAYSLFVDILPKQHHGKSCCLGVCGDEYYSKLAYRIMHLSCLFKSPTRLEN